MKCSNCPNFYYREIIYKGKKVFYKSIEMWYKSITISDFYKFVITLINFLILGIMSIKKNVPYKTHCTLCE